MVSSGLHDINVVDLDEMSSGGGYVAGSSQSFIAWVMDDYMTERRDAEVGSAVEPARSACRREHNSATPELLRKPIRTLSCG